MNVNIYMDEKLNRDLKRVSLKYDRSISYIVRQAIERYLASLKVLPFTDET